MSPGDRVDDLVIEAPFAQELAESLRDAWRVSGRRSGARLIQQAIDPLVQEATAPFANRLLGHPQLAVHLRLRVASRGAQSYAHPQRQRLGSRRPPCQRS